jgi:hypothetical protein
VTVPLDGGELEVEVSDDLHVNLTGWAVPVYRASWPTSSSRSCMQPADRLGRIPPYLFAELERKIAAKRAAGVDVISLGIGDPTAHARARSSTRWRRRSPSPARTTTRPTAARPSSARR